MPHCIVEHSNDIDGAFVNSLVHMAAKDSQLFDNQSSDIKVRSIEYANYKTGSLDLKFVHVTLRILSGRTPEQKVGLTKLVCTKLAEANLTNCSISVEVQDIDRDSYAKVIC